MVRADLALIGVEVTAAPARPRFALLTKVVHENQVISTPYVIRPAKARPVEGGHAVRVVYKHVSQAHALIDALAQAADKVVEEVHCLLATERADDAEAVREVVERLARGFIRPSR